MLLDKMLGETNDQKKKWVFFFGTASLWILRHRAFCQRINHLFSLFWFSDCLLLRERAVRLLLTFAWLCCFALHHSGKAKGCEKEKRDSVFFFFDVFNSCFFFSPSSSGSCEVIHHWGKRLNPTHASVLLMAFNNRAMRIVTLWSWRLLSSLPFAHFLK